MNRYPKEPKLLIVDDNPGDVDLLLECLDDAKRKVKTYVANDLHGACELIDNELPDLVLLDLGLPDSHGLDSLRSILDRFPELAIVVLTGNMDDQMALEAIDTGAQDYIIKGEFDIISLERIIMHSIRRQLVANLLAESRKNYSALFNNMTVGFASHRMVYDKDGKPCDYEFLQVNPEFEKLTGLAASDIIGKTVREILPGTELHWIRKYGEVADTQIPQEFEEYSVELDKYFSVFAFSQMKGMFAVLVKDITQEKLSKRRQHLVRSCLSVLNHSLSREDIVKGLIDLLKDYSGADVVAVRLNNEDRFPVYDARFSDVESQLPLNEFCMPVKGNGSNCPESGHCVCSAIIENSGQLDRDLYTKNGSFVCNSIAAAKQKKTFCSDKVRGCFMAGYQSIAVIPVYCCGVTIGLIHFNFLKENMLSIAFVEAVEAISQALGIALERVNHMDELADALDKAQAASKAKSEFLTMMSHEIRTPLNGILGFSGIIRDMLSEPGYAKNMNEIMDDLSIIKDCGTSLTDILNDILELSSIESGSLNIVEQEFAPFDIINECVNIFVQPAKNHGTFINLEIESLPESVLGDPKRLRQVLFNLVGNAVKFTQDGQVSVNATFNKDKLYIDVIDTGIGISDDMIEKILEPFTQADLSNTRKYGGAGMGLTIVSKLLDKMGGKLKIQSKLGVGSTFSFIFPVKSLSVPVDKACASEANSNVAVNKRDIKELHKLRILAIEDDLVNKLYIKKILEKAGFEFQMAETFAEMKKICNKGFFPDLALVDIALPDSDGFECLKWLKKKFPEQNMKFVAQTAHVLSDKTPLYKKAGFDRFIGKPYKRQDLLELINELTASIKS